MDAEGTDIVVAHDQMWVYGGAERVAMAISEALDVPIVVPYAGESARDAAAEAGVELRTFAQDRYSGLGSWRRREGFKSLNLVLDWQTAPLEEYDLVFSTHMYSRHYRTLDHQYLLNYCHSPPRWLNDLESSRLQSLPRFVRTPAKLFMTVMDVFDDRSSRRVDAFIANSEVIRERIRRYYRRDASVIYPPIDTTHLDPTESSGEYYLLLGRVVKAKRPDVVVEAFNDLDLPLKVAGEGISDSILGANTLERIQRQADENVEFLGYVSTDEKRELLQNARGVVYIPVREDFGMVPIEAFAAGTPVIAADEGFPRIAVDDGETGAIVEPTVDGVKRAVGRLESMDFDVDRLAEEAEKYSTERFADAIRDAVDEFIEHDGYRVSASEQFES